MRNKVCYLVISLLACLGLACACGHIDWERVWDKWDGGSWAVPVTRAVYDFDPSLIATTLPIEFLTPVPLISPLPTPEARGDLVMLNDDVLYSIANGLLETGKEPALVSAGFEFHCDNVGFGPHFGSFVYVRRIDRTPSLPYLVEYVFIHVEQGRIVYSSYEANSLELYVRKPAIDYLSLPIRIDEAMRIAEDAGGCEFRDSVNYACVIRGRLGGYGKPDEWEVNYVTDGEEPERTFAVRVDAESGEVSP